MTVVHGSMVLDEISSLTDAQAERGNVRNVARRAAGWLLAVTTILSLETVSAQEQAAVAEAATSIRDLPGESIDIEPDPTDELLQRKIVWGQCPPVPADIPNVGDQKCAQVRVPLGVMMATSRGSQMFLTMNAIEAPWFDGGDCVGRGVSNSLNNLSSARSWLNHFLSHGSHLRQSSVVLTTMS